MPSTINNQNLFLDTQFQQFVQFAETAIAAGKQKAIGRRRSPASKRPKSAGSPTAPSCPGPATGSASGWDVSAA